MSMIKRGRRSGAFVMHTIVGLGSLASFAPRTAHNVSIPGVDPHRSDLEALAGDWKRLGSDMRNAIEVEREKAASDAS